MYISVISVILVLSILAGQLIKFPLFGIQGPTLLDFSAFLICLFGIYKLKFKLKKPDSIIIYGLFFILIALLSLIFTPLHLTFSEFMISFSYTLRFLIYLLFFWIIYSGVFKEFKKNIRFTLLFSGIGLSILGLLQFVLFPNLQSLQNQGWDPHYFRTVSTFLDPNFAGAYFVLTLLLLIQNFAIAKKWNLFIFTIVYIALLTTFSRSSYIMFLISGIILSILRKSRKLFISTIILFAILMLGFYLYTLLVAKPRGIDREQSASYRLGTWENGLAIFQKSPILGVGFNAYKYALDKYHLSDSQFLQSRGATTNDSSLLYVLSTTGIVGFLIYSLFLFSIIKQGLINNKFLVAAIFGLIIHSFFANSLFYPFILIWILLKASDITD